jgi:hypothetical protein
MSSWKPTPKGQLPLTRGDRSDVSALRHARRQAQLNYIFDRAGRACKIQGQKHLYDFEAKS